MKSGMSHEGKEITGVEYLRQRISDVFKTPLGTIPLARGYGTKSYDLVDENVTPDFKMTAYENTVDDFTNPANDLDDCKFLSMSITSVNDIVQIDIKVKFEGNEVSLKGLNYG